MATHRMAKDRALVADRECGLDQLWQFIHHIVVHLVVTVPRGLRCVDVKSSPLTQIIAIIISDTHTTRAGIGGDNRNAKLCCDTSSTGLLHKILVRTR